MEKKEFAEKVAKWNELTKEINRLRREADKKQDEAASLSWEIDAACRKNKELMKLL